MAAATAEDIALLVRLAQRDDAGAQRCLRARRAALDRLVETAVAEGLAVVLLRGLAHSPLRAALSRAQLERLEAQRCRQAMRSRILLPALTNLAERFASAGQPFMLLKGPYLAARFYGDVQGREFVDLDLLVPRADRARACRVLAGAGYGRRSRMLLGAGLTSFFVHGFDFAAGGASVDLHWDLARHFSLRLDERRVWAGRGSFALDGRSYAVLSDEHEVVLAVLALLRDIERGRPKIKNVVDVVQVVSATDAEIDWEALFENGRAEGTFGPLVNILGLCLEIADASDLAPRLAAALGRHAQRRVPLRPAQMPLQFRPARYGIGNKLWSARVYDATPVGWLLWWGVSLPFRVAVHGWRRP